MKYAEQRNMCETMTQTLKRNITRKVSRNKRDDNVKVDTDVISCESVDCIQVPNNRVQWWVL